MKNTKTAELIERYKEICTEIVKQFEHKHGYAFHGFIGDSCEIANFIGQYYFSMSDIIYDLENKCPKGLIFKWQNDCLEDEGKNINFRSYLIRLRFEHININNETTETKDI